MGHVNNAVFFTYFEEGRKFFFHHITGSSDPSAFNFILAHIRCDYLRPVKLSDRLSLHMRVSDIGRKRFNLEYRLVNASDESCVYAKGESVQVCFDYKENKSAEVTESLREKLLEYSGAF
jgi:acyl-CoA thioester hydrolase